MSPKQNKRLTIKSPWYIIAKAKIYKGRFIMSENKKKFKTVDLVYIALFAVLIAVCSWISIPFAVPFTLQTLGVFVAVGILGGRRGTFSVLVYVILGAIGLPVFAGFTAGLGRLLGQTGGYIIGFIFAALAYWLITKFFGTKVYVMAIAMVIGLLICYTFGTAWFMYVYIANTGALSIATALSWCVIPYIIPDLIKIALAILISKRVLKIVII